MIQTCETSSASRHVTSKSGPGAWLFWLLVDDDDPTKAPTGRQGNRTLLQRINRQLLDNLSNAFRHLELDPAGVDLAKLIRIPGSVNSKSNTYVNFMMTRTANDGPLTYTLDGLAEEVGVKRGWSYYRRERSTPVGVASLCALNRSQV
jgi:hypothetical protein